MTLQFILNLLIILKKITMKKWSLTTKIIVGVLTVGVIGTGIYLIAGAVKKSGTRSKDVEKENRTIILTK
jgi:L-cystine uptake protein TcyP (sodium:dicarboxylate symporter family)